MTITFNSKTYTADAATSANSIPYLGTANTISVKDRLELSRVPPKGNSVYSGNARARSKMTRTNVLTGAKTSSADMIVDLSASIPVGTSDAAVDAVCADLGALVVTTAFKDLLKKQQISY